MSESFTSLSKHECYQIFNYLRVRDLVPLLFLNKRINNFILAYFHENRSIKIQKYDIQRLTRDSSIKSFFKTFPNLQILKINAYNFTADSLKYLPRTLTYLNLLNCEEYLLLKSDFYFNIQHRLSKTLKELHIEYNKYISDRLPRSENDEIELVITQFAQEMSKLESLTVWALSPEEHRYHLQSLNNLFFYAFYQHSESLKSINFNSLVCSHLTRLCKTKISNIKIKTVEGKLTETLLDQQIFGINDETISFLTQYFPKIDNLSICDFTMSFRKNLSDTALLNFITKNPDLKTLYLNSYSYKFHLNEMTILQTLSSLQNLNSFGLASCKNFQLGNAISVTPNLFTIRDLNLDFTDIDDYAIQLARDLFGNLKSISLKCCRKITQEGFVYLTKRLINLEGCNFKYNINFDSSALQSLLYYATKLKKIKLANNHISNRDLITIFHRVRNLKELAFCSMNDSDEFTSDCFYEVYSDPLCQANVFWKIKSLDFSSNTHLTNQSIQDLSKFGLENLCFLSLQNCLKITEEAFIYIASAIFADKLLEINLCIHGLKISFDVFGAYIPSLKRLASLYLYETSNSRDLAEDYYDINFFLKP